MEIAKCIDQKLKEPHGNHGDLSGSVEAPEEQAGSAKLRALDRGGNTTRGGTFWVRSFLPKSCLDFSPRHSSIVFLYIRWRLFHSASLFCQQLSTRYPSIIHYAAFLFLHEERVHSSFFLFLFLLTYLEPTRILN